MERGLLALYGKSLEGVFWGIRVGVVIRMSCLWDSGDASSPMLLEGSNQVFEVHCPQLLIPLCIVLQGEVGLSSLSLQ